MIPTKPLIKFQSGSQTEAYHWLRSIQPVAPSSTFLAEIPLEERPCRPPDAQDQTPYPGGPLPLNAVCPKTGAALRLHVFRDLSAVLLRQNLGDLSKWTALPATLGLSSESYDISAKNVPFEERAETVPHLRLQAHPDGLRWKAFNATLTTSDITSLITHDMCNLAVRILDALPVADPRAHRYCPDGARFAPWQRWPEADPEDPSLKMLSLRVTALVQHFSQISGDDFMHVCLRRQRPAEPWSAPSPAQAADCMHAGGARDIEAALRKTLRALIKHPVIGPPDMFRFGDDGAPLLVLTDCGVGESAHARLASHRTLQDIVKHIPAPYAS